MLLLENFKDMTLDQLTDYLVRSWGVEPSTLAKYDILIGYEGDGNYEGAAFFLLRGKDGGKLYTVHSTHCSCYGHEGNFEPEEAQLEYLKSDKLHIYTCDEGDHVECEIRDFIANLTE